MSEISREGFVPRHLRGIDLDEKYHSQAFCQWHAIATTRLRDWQLEYDDHGNLVQKRCNEPIWDQSGLRLCREHTTRIGHLNPNLYTLRNAKKQLWWQEDQDKQFLRDEIARLHRTIAWQAKRLRGDDEPEKKKPRTSGTIYALLSGYNVKVGWTGRNLEDRLREYPPSTVLLVHYPGYRGDETRIKRKFAHLRTHGKEWFPYAPQVTEWVDQMVREHGAPDPNITCGPAKYQVPRPYADKAVVKPRYWTGKTA